MDSLRNKNRKPTHPGSRIQVHHTTPASCVRATVHNPSHPGEILRENSLGSNLVL